MIIGVPKEVKTEEYRVGLVPASVHELVTRGHQVIVQAGAGLGIAISDGDYQQAGAEIVSDAQAIFDTAELIVKVKEPQPEECKMLRPEQVLFTYLHLAPDPEQTHLLLESGCTAIAYETVTNVHGGLPLLSPMSEVAGRMSIQAAAHSLEKSQGGCGLLLGGVPGVAPAKVVVLGGGTVGTNAIRMAIGMEANVSVLDSYLPRLKELDLQFGAKLNTIFATAQAVEEYVIDADVVIGAVLVPGAAAPHLVTRQHIQAMRQGTVVIDVSIDQGGCFETSHPTTHTDPTYLVDGVVHYCVANMPGAAPRTAAFALNNATLPFVLALADKGARQAMTDDLHLRHGLNIDKGHVTCAAVAEALDLPYLSADEALGL